MAPISSLLQFSAYAGILHYATYASGAAIERRYTSKYAPTVATCPSGSLVRDATSISSDESAYYTSRKANADTALATWLQKTSSSFATTDLPSIGLALSGGGYRAMLAGAGVIQGFDDRESDSAVAGIFQSLTYQSALSGGAWLTSSFAGNNWPTISSLRDNLWEDALADSLLVPEKLLTLVAYSEIVADIEAKEAAGFYPTLVDAWGRLLSYQLLYGSDGGVTKTLSGLTSYSNFTSHAVPYPIITSRGVLSWDDDCLPAANGTQYEFTPYEFGSWDEGVAAFTKTKYLGTNYTNGSPTVSGRCYTNYDNLGFVLGTSSDIFNDYCTTDSVITSSSTILTALEDVITNVHSPITKDEFADYPNPFYKFPASTLVNQHTELTLADGGEALQNVPLWPLIQPYRDVDVIIISDNSADTNNWPNGTEIQTTYQQAVAQGLTKMPFIPAPEVFVSEGLNTRATFFGCNDTSVVTLVYLPNADYTYASNIDTVVIDETKATTNGVIENGNAIASQNGTEGWPVCLGCAIMAKTGTTLPSDCTACFETYCYYE